MLRELFKERDSLKVALPLLKLCGNHPKQTSFLSKLIVIFYLTVTIVIFPLVLLKFYYYDGNIEDLVASCEAAMTFYQFFLKTVIIKIYKQKTSQLLDTIEAFWSVDDTYSEEVRKDVKLVNDLAWLINTAYRNGGLTLMIVLILSPIFASTRRTPLVCWMPEGNPSPLCEIIWLCQTIIIVAVTVFVAGFDSYYVAACVKGGVEFKLIGDKLQKSLENDIINEEEEHKHMETVKECVRHHLVLLQYCEDLETIFSFLFLNQYIINVLTLCMELYLVSESLENCETTAECLAFVGRSFVYICQSLLELAMYCIPATVLTTESFNVSLAIYNSKWYKLKNKSLQQNVSIILMNTQRPVVLTAGGFRPINMELFSTVLNTGISFYTFLKSKKE